MLYGPRDLRLEDVSIPRPLSGWCLIKTKAVGICGTDKAFYLGTYPLFKKPLIPGHEVVGEVVEGPEDLVGRRVIPEINFSCGRCYYCRLGLYTQCPYKKTLGLDLDGGMAEYFIAPVEALHLAEDLDPIIGVEVEPLAAVLNMFEQYPPTPTMKVAVIGSGNLAILTVQVLKLLGIDEPVVIVRRGSVKQKYIKQLAVETICLDEIEDYVKKNTPEGQGFDMVIEATGSNKGLEIAVKITKPRGIIHMKSTPGGLAEFNQTLAVVKELRIIGTRCGTFKEFKRAIELLARGHVKPIITSTMGLKQGELAFEKALEKEQVKVVIVNK